MNENKQNIEDFLNQKIKKENGFSTPNDYFNELENDLVSKLLVENLPEKCGFETPESYFDNLENSILNKINDSQDDKKVKVIPLRKKILRYTSVAAAAAVILFITIQSITGINSESDSTITIDQWFEENDVNSYELAVLLDIQDFSESDDLNNNTVLSLDNENIEDYLDDIDNSSLLDEIQ